jgi:hypothetical protein
MIRRRTVERSDRVTNPYRSEKIANWVGDFCESPAFRDHPPLVREYAPETLTAFLEAACRQRDVEPDEIEESDLLPALREGVAPLEMAQSARADVPALCAGFLAEMEAQGRLGGGRMLGVHVRALKRAFLDAAAGRSPPIRSAGSKLGRNDPCPCGSGRKYKKCCMNRP